MPFRLPLGSVSMSVLLAEAGFVEETEEYFEELFPSHLMQSRLLVATHFPNLAARPKQ